MSTTFQPGTVRQIGKKKGVAGYSHPNHPHRN